MTCEPIECPICYEEIGLKNNITTECGHQFHASCIMKNITLNGFGCPCCRTVMAEEPDDDDDDDMPSLIDDDTDTLLDERYEEDEPFSDDALRGLRLLTNLLENEEHDQYDVVAEHQYVEAGQEGDDDYEPGLVPSIEDMVKILRERGFTYEKLVESIIVDHEEYQNDESLQRTGDRLWKECREIISNYSVIINNNEPVPGETHEAQIVEAVESPIHVAADEIFEIEMPDMSYTHRDVAHAELDELRIDLDRFMIELGVIQPQRLLIHV